MKKIMQFFLEGESLILNSFRGSKLQKIQESDAPRAFFPYN